MHVIEEDPIPLKAGEKVVTVIEFRSIVFVITDKGSVYRVVPISSDMAHD